MLEKEQGWYYTSPATRGYCPPASSADQPTDWEKVGKVILALKLILVAIKCVESDTATIDEVILLLKKLNHKINQVTSSGIGTLNTAVLRRARELNKYFVLKYNVDTKK